MKIQALTSPFYKTNLNFKNNLQNSLVNSQTLISSFESPVVFENTLNFDIQEKQFEYSSISSVKKMTALVGNYGNLDKFCELMAQKLNSQLSPISKDDIASLISRIKEKTNAPEKQIKEILYQLTLFSRYDSLNLFEKQILDNQISKFGLVYFHLGITTPEFSSNGCMEYLVNQKKQIQHPNYTNGALILDDDILSQLEKFKNSDNSYDKRTYQGFITQLKTDTLKILNPLGWDIKCSDGKYRSANMFCGSGFLESLAIDVINRIKSGEKSENILSNDNAKRFCELVKDDLKAEEINIIQIPENVSDDEKTIDDIFDNLKIQQFDKDFVQKTIQKYIDLNCPNDVRKIDLQIALCKLLDEQSIIYSIDSLSSQLKTLCGLIVKNLKLCGFNQENIVYYVPDATKSFSIINYMYKKINEISSDNISIPDTFNAVDSNTDKAKVILDDITASGLTQEHSCLQVRSATLVDNMPLRYASILSCESANKYIDTFSTFDRGIFCKKIFDLGALYNIRGNISELKLSVDSYNNPEDFLKDYKKSYCKNNFKTLTTKDIDILKKTLYLGYYSNGLSCAFPYMIPDNNNDLASLLFQKLLYRNNQQANKTLAVIHSKPSEKSKKYDEITNSQGIVKY